MLGMGVLGLGRWKLTYELGHCDAHAVHLPFTVEYPVVLHRRQLHLHVTLTLNCGGPGKSKVSSTLQTITWVPLLPAAPGSTHLNDYPGPCGKD